MPANNAIALTKLALLIDGDNVQAKFMPEIMGHLAGVGTVAIRRVYGQFSDGRMKKWEKAIAEFDLTPVDVKPARSGKNATDIKLAIEAMDLVAGRGLDGVCIASSDSDFSPLAARIRQATVAAYGIGEGKAVKAYKDAFDRFFPLSGEEKPKAAPAKRQPTPKQPAKRPAAKAAPAATKASGSPRVSRQPPAKAAQPAPKTTIAAAGASPVPREQLLAAMDQVKSSDGWSHARDLGHELSRRGYSPAKSGLKVAALVKMHLDALEVEKRGNDTFVRRKP